MPLAAGRGGGDLAEGAIAAQQFAVLQIVVRPVELRRVGKIERFRAELQLPALGDREVLKRRKVERAIGRRRLALQSEITAGEGCRNRHAADIKPLVGRAAAGGRVVGISARNRIGPAGAPDALTYVKAKRVRLTR